MTARDQPRHTSASGTALVFVPAYTEPHLDIWLVHRPAASPRFRNGYRLFTNDTTMQFEVLPTEVGNRKKKKKKKESPPCMVLSFWQRSRYQVVRKIR